MACTNEKPCLQPVLRWVHSGVCQKLTEQGKVAKERSPKMQKSRIDHAADAELRREAERVAKRYAHVGGRVEDDGSVTQTVTMSDSPERPLTNATARIGCACGKEWVPSRKAEYTKDGIVHRYGNPCYAEGGPKGEPAPYVPSAKRTGPLQALAESFARLAEQAKEDRKRTERGSWEDGEAAGRFNAYRNAAARVANLLGEEG